MNNSKANNSEVVIVGMARTPFGSFQGALSQIPAPRLGATAIKAALERAKVDPAKVSEVIMGNVLAAGVGQAPARQASLYAGIPNSVPCLTINKVCGSGMKAIMLGVQSIQLGDSEVVVAGGMENMSLAPYLLQGVRGGLKMGDRPVLDSMIHDGLWDPYKNQHMGSCGELCAKEKGFSRKDQDHFATESYKRAQKAWAEGKFDSEITPVMIKDKKGEVAFAKDEGPAKVKFEKIPELKPAFDPNGTVTAANASSINDGAVALVLTSADYAKRAGLTPLARIVSVATHAQAPEWFTTAPTEAMQKAVRKAGENSGSPWDLPSIDLVEVNEAFAVVSLSAMRDLGIPHEKINVWGGAIALGHPIGASGARIVVTLISALRDQKKKRGLAGICIGGGEATALCVEVL